MEDNKKLWQSRTALTGATIIMLAVSEAVINGLTWRECVGAGLGAAVIVFRTVATKRLTK
jgi:hypothetical protein